MKRFICIAIAAIGLLSSGGPAMAQRAKFEELYPSIVRVGVITEGSLSLGSGVVVSRDAQGSFVITNYHVVEGATANSIRVLAPKIGGGTTNGRTEVEEVAATYWGGDPAGDLAILYVRNFFRDPLSLSVANASADMPIRAIGYPVVNDLQWRRLNETPALRDGIVSTTVTTPWRTGQPAIAQIQHTADLEKGMSGGPLVDLCGRVIGMNTAYIQTANSGYMALSTADIIPYLKKTNLDFKQVSEACDPDAKPAALVPAVQKQAPAVVTPPAPKASGLAVPLIIGGALLLAAIVGGVAFLLWRRKPVAVVATKPEHGLLLRGIDERGGSTLVIRADDIMVDGGVQIGRTATFGSAKTSRKHARLTWSPEQGYLLCDLGSANDTFINGAGIKGLGDKPVRSGDTIEFGDRDARYVVERL